MIIIRKSAFSIIVSNCDRSDIIADLQKLNICSDLNCRHFKYIRGLDENQETGDSRTFLGFSNACLSQTAATSGWRQFKINWVTWVLVLIFRYFVSSSTAAINQTNLWRDTHSFLVPTVNIQRCRWVWALTKTIDRWLYPEGCQRSHAHDLLEAVSFQFTEMHLQQGKMQSHGMWVVNKSNLTFSWPGCNPLDIWSAVTQEAFTLKAAINIHCCRWVYIKITHWSMNADCGSNTSVTSVQWASNETAEEI